MKRKSICPAFRDQSWLGWSISSTRYALSFRPFALSPGYETTLQALGAIVTTDEVSRQCLRKLQALCGDNTTLPSSYTVSGDLARVGDEPVAFGGFADVWEGAHRGTKVCIKVLRVTLNDDPALTKVRTGTPFPRLR